MTHRPLNGYHHVRLALEGAEAVSEKIPAMEDAQAIRDVCDGQRAVCVSLVREKKTEKPPKLYDLTTLQREANRVFGYTAKQTLDYAQSLYEKKLLTYPRLALPFFFCSGCVAVDQSSSNSLEGGIFSTWAILNNVSRDTPRTVPVPST